MLGHSQSLQVLLDLTEEVYTIYIIGKSNVLDAI